MSTSPDDENIRPEDGEVSKVELFRLLENVTDRLSENKGSPAESFIRVFPPAWTPLRLNMNTIVLHNKLEFIYQFAHQNARGANGYLCQVLCEEDQPRAIAIISLQSTGISREEWLAPFLDVSYRLGY